MASPLGKLTAVLGLDATAFEQGIGKAQSSIGGFGTGTSAAFAAVGSAAALGFGVATKGALEAEQAQGKFMAATGASREEAKAFVSQMDSLAGSSGAVGKTFGEIAAVGTMVEQQFGTTGQATTDLTEDVLEFSKVTGQDATAAAGQLEDTLSAYGLSAEDAAGFMDMLVASNQEFGTDAGPETLSILQSMAPAMQALGMDAGDASALLNAFEVAGVDAASAQRGLNSAITNLPPGTTMEEFLQHLQDLRNQGIDPTSEAIDVFGTKAGAGLALTIKPGGHALDDFRVDAEDAAGAVDKAADDMLTFGDRIKGFADKALAGAREVGNEFGPAVTGLASITSLAAPFANGLKGLFSGLIAKVLPSAAAVGAATGAAEAEAHVAGSTGVSFLTKIKSAFSGMISSLIPSAVAVGVATGTAEGEAHAEAAAGPGVIKSLVAKIGAMSIPLAASGTTVGTAIGGAMAVATAAAWAAGLIAGGLIIEYAPAIGVELGKAFVTKGFQDNFIAAGRTAATTYAAGYAAEVRDHAGQVFEDATRAALASGATDAAALAAGEAAVKQYLSGFEKAIPTTSPDFVGPLMGAITPPPTLVEDTAEQTAGSFNTGFVGGIADREADMHNAIVAAVNAAAAADAAIYQPFVDLGKGIVSKLTQTLWDDRDKLESTAQSLRDILTNGLSPEEQATEAEGKKYIRLVRRGMNSEKAGAKETAQQVAAAAIKSIEDTAVNGALDAPGAKAVGKYLGALFNSGLDAKQTDALLSGAGLSAEAIQGIHDKFPQFFGVGAGAGGKVDTGFGSKDHYGAGSDAAGDIHSGLNNHPWNTWGRNVAAQWIAGLEARLASSREGIYHAIRVGSGGLIAFSPPREGPLKDINKFGVRTAQAWVEGMTSTIAGSSGSIENSLGRISGLFGETPRGLEYATARVASLGVTAPGLGIAATVGNRAEQPIIVNLYGNHYGGPAGLRQLSAEIQAAVRQATRGANREVGR